jgi:hypothetical protein
LYSRGKSNIKFFHQRPEAFAKGAINWTKDVVSFQVFPVHAAAGNDVVADLLKPRHLVRCECHGFQALLFDPFGESSPDVFLERLEHGLLLERDAD